MSQANTEAAMAARAPGLLDISAHAALGVVTATEYWRQWFPGDGILRPTIVETWQPGWLGLRPHLLHETGQETVAHVEWASGHPVIVLKPGLDGLTAVHEAAHVLSPGDRDHGTAWAGHFEALVEVWLAAQGEEEAA